MICACTSFITFMQRLIRFDFVNHIYKVVLRGEKNVGFGCAGFPLSYGAFLSGDEIPRIYSAPFYDNLFLYGECSYN